MTGAIHVKETEANHATNDKLHETSEEVEGDKEVKVALDALSWVTNVTCPLVETVIIQGSPELKKTEHHYTVNSKHTRRISFGSSMIG
jgi:hypothetical protein